MIDKVNGIEIDCGELLPLPNSLRGCRVEADYYDYALVYIESIPLPNAIQAIQLNIGDRSSYRIMLKIRELLDRVCTICPKIKFLRLMIVHSLENDIDGQNLIKTISRMESLQVLQIFHEVPKNLAFFKNLINLTKKIKICFFALKKRARVIQYYNKQALTPATIYKMQKTDPESFNRTYLDSTILLQAHKVNEWKVVNLYCFGVNDREIWKIEIFKKISEIYFSQLQIIKLQSCQIESIQPISRTRIPQIKQIHLGMNKIVSLSPLRKLNLSNLNSLHLANNNIIHLQFINQLYIYGKQNSKQIILQNIQQNACQCQNLSCFLKLMNNSYMFYLSVKSEQRIKQQRVNSSLKQKFRRVIKIYNY